MYIFFFFNFIISINRISLQTLPKKNRKKCNNINILRVNIIVPHIYNGPFMVYNFIFRFHEIPIVVALTAGCLATWTFNKYIFLPADQDQNEKRNIKWLLHIYRCLLLYTYMCSMYYSTYMYCLPCTNDPYTKLSIGRSMNFYRNRCVFFFFFYFIENAYVKNNNNNSIEIHSTTKCLLLNGSQVSSLSGYVMMNYYITRIYKRPQWLS